MDLSSPEAIRQNKRTAEQEAHRTGHRPRIDFGNAAPAASVF
jgi:hypothetical protein